MCARFTVHSPPDEIAAALGVADVPRVRPLYNVAPSTLVMTAALKADDATRGWGWLKWGLVPNWSPDGEPGPVNARAETVADKPTFAEPFRRRRCLVAADGFYEFQAVTGGKDPHHFRLRTGKPFAFAGVWDTWRGGDKPVHSCAIITTVPNELVGQVHDRMPVILRPEDYGLWLDRGVTDPTALLPLLAPYPAALMERVAVSRYVNDVRHQGPQCVEPAEVTAKKMAGPQQNLLF